MKNLFWGIVILPLFSASQYTYKNLEVNYMERNNEAAAYAYGNLRLYPVRAKESFKKEFNGVGKYMSLKDAVEEKKVKITESGNGGMVNTLQIENTSKDTIIIIIGDVVKGGKQDRIVSQDLVIAPGKGKKNLSVYCVESGRRSPRDETISNANRNSAAANYSSTPQEFKSYYNKGSVSLRKTVDKEKDQTKVWNKVDELNATNMTLTDTKTYTAMDQSADFTKKQNQYLAFFKNKFDKDSNVVGVLVITGNKVIGCDIFATHDLFLKQYESLLHSYITEAVVNGKPVNISSSSVKTYTDKLLANESVQESTLKEKGSSFTEKGKKLRVSSYD